MESPPPLPLLPNITTADRAKVYVAALAGGCLCACLLQAQRDLDTVRQAPGQGEEEEADVVVAAAAQGHAAGKAVPQSFDEVVERFWAGSIPLDEFALRLSFVLQSQGFTASNTVAAVSTPLDALMRPFRAALAHFWPDFTAITSLAGLPSYGETGLRAALSNVLQPSSSSSSRQRRRSTGSKLVVVACAHVAVAEDGGQPSYRWTQPRPGHSPALRFRLALTGCLRWCTAGTVGECSVLGQGSNGRLCHGCTALISLRQELLQGRLSVALEPGDMVSYSCTLLCDSDVLAHACRIG